MKPLRKVIAAARFGLEGRGRETMLESGSVEELVRQYDGADNPVGKSYSTAEAEALFTPHFKVEQRFLHFFPTRAIPFRLPNRLHRLCDRHLGFVIYFNLRRP